MNFRYLSLAALLCLAACNGSDSQAPVTETEDSTFADAAGAKAQLDEINGQIAAAQKKRDELAAESQTIGSTVTEKRKALDDLIEQARIEADGIEQARAALEELQGDGANNPGKIVEATTRLNGLIREAGEKTDELDKAQKKLAVLNAGADEPGSIAAARKDLERLKGDGKGTPGEIAAAQRELEELELQLVALKGDGADKKGSITEAQEELALLKGDGADKKGSIKQAEDELDSLKDLVTTKTAELQDAQKALDDLTREDKDNPGKIAVAQKTLDDLVAQAVVKAEELRLASEELERLKIEGKKITDDATLAAGKITDDATLAATKITDVATLDAARIIGDALQKAGADMFKQANMLPQAGEMFASAGMEDEAFELLAPKDYVREDKAIYNAGIDAALELTAISETPSVKRQTIKLGDKSMPYTAKAGHLIAYAPKDPTNPDKKDAQAAIFYMAYTREGLPHEKRPVTFFFNGGPGEPSIWLHMGSFAPKRLETGEPVIPASALKARPASFPLVDNEESILDKSDIVFVDPPGAGFSQAIKPHTNREFWGPEVDAKLLRDFIVRYTNVNKRQLSPKYIYGESYSGIRVPILTRLIEEGGKGQYEPDPSGKDPVVLSGFVLNAPIMSYVSNCRYAGVSCTGFVPAYAMLADYHKLSKVNGLATIPASVDTLRTFVSGTFIPAFEKYLKKNTTQDWNTYIATPAGTKFLQDLSDKTGVAVNDWKLDLKMSGSTFMGKIKSGNSYNAYDARMLVPFVGGVKVYDPTYYEDAAFDKGIADLLPSYLNYKNTATYMTSNIAPKGTSPANANWNWGAAGRNATSSIPDLQATLGYDPGLKVLIVHGYYDLATPFYQTELDLKNVGLAERVPVKSFKGGHMIYVSKEARVPLKAALDEYYDAPPYTPPVTDAGLTLN